MRHGITAGAAAEGVGFVQNQHGSVLVDQVLCLCPIAVCGQHHADIGHHRFGQYTGNVTTAQGRRQRRQVVELHHHGVLGEVVHLTQ